MKRQIQKVGVRKWFGDDFINLQDELYTALEALLSPYGNYIISGCEVDNYSVLPGIVCIDGKIARFEGTPTPGLPCYLSLEITEIDNRLYQNGSSLPTREYYKAIANSSIPVGSYITINVGSRRTFLDAIQSSAYRFASDTEKAKWNGGVGSTLNADLLDGQHGSYYLPASSYTAADVLTKIKTVDGSGSSLDADFLDGQHGSYYLPASSYTASDVLTKIKTVDGASSGLDADLLDGQHGSYYLPASSFTDRNPVSANSTVVTTSELFAGDLNTIKSTCSLGVSASATNKPGTAGGFMTTTFSDGQCAQFFFQAQYLSTPTLSSRTFIAGQWSLWFPYFNVNNDGSGSGLDADLLDSYHASSFLRPEAWQSVTSFASGWTGNFSIRKINNMVHIRAIVQNGTTFTNHFTALLPSGYRPANELHLPVIKLTSNGAISSSSLNIDPNGNILIKDTITIAFSDKYTIDVIFSTESF
jgi:hypothetical protein